MICMMNDLFLMNMIDIPTHKDNNIIDLILVNDIDFISDIWTDENNKIFWPQNRELYSRCYE